jgi:hypothetical protein
MRQLIRPALSTDGGNIMKSIAALAGLGVVCAALVASHGGLLAAEAPEAPATEEKPGTVERAALAEVDFLVGDWEGEGWALARSGERQRFWVKEYYRYRGDKDLLDMEGRFGDIFEDGTRTGELEYALGILYYAKEPGEYRMWHYSDSGDVFTVVMDVDVAKREMQYTKEYSEGRIGRFHLAIGDDGVWITKLEILQPDQTWRQTMEFRMERVRP